MCKNVLGHTVRVGLVSFALVLGLGGCGEEEGPAERAGQSLDKAVEETSEQVKEAGEEMKKGAESLMDETKQLLDTKDE